MKFLTTFAFLALASTTTYALKLYDHEQAPTIHSDPKKNQPFKIVYE